MFPWVVAVAMVAMYLLIRGLPVAREFYELSPLPPTTIGPLLLAGLAWTLVVHVLRGPVGRLENDLSRLARRIWPKERAT